MIDIIDRAIANAQDIVATLTELKKAYMIAELLGLPPKSIKGKTGTKITQLGYGAKPWLKSTFHIRVEGGEWKDFRLVDVPPLLWPPEWQQQYKP